MNGANSDGKNYEPDVTSYDYNAPLDESGQPTPKYYRFRDIIAKDTGIKPPPVPAAPATMTLPAVSLDEGVSLWESLPAAIHSERPLSMEAFGQAYGYILYRTQLDGPVDSVLTFDTVHDYAQIYVDGKLVGTLDRRLGQLQLPLHVSSAHAQLDVLVENTGRVNFGPSLPAERAGLVGRVKLGQKVLTGWDVYPLPMLKPDQMAYSQSALQRSVFLPGQLHGDHAEGYVSGYQRADEGRSVAEWPRPGTFLERWPAEDALHTRAVVEAG